MVNATDDPINPYEGGPLVLVRLPNGKTLGDRGLHMSGKRTARVLARNWETLGVTEEEGENDPSSSYAAHASSDAVTRHDWTVKARPVVRLVSMIGEGHHISVPGGS